MPPCQQKVAFDLVKYRLNRMAEGLDDATLRGIKVTDKRWSREDLIALCNVFANEWHKAQNDLFQTLDEGFKSEMNAFEKDMIDYVLVLIVDTNFK